MNTGHNNCVTNLPQFLMLLCLRCNYFPRDILLDFYLISRFYVMRFRSLLLYPYFLHTCLVPLHFPLNFSLILVAYWLGLDIPDSCFHIPYSVMSWKTSGCKMNMNYSKPLQPSTLGRGHTKCIVKPSASKSMPRLFFFSRNWITLRDRILQSFFLFYFFLI
jgi:hypothetical protein